jgi:PKD repeat protein
MSGSAQNGSDYQNLSGSTTISAGSSSANITVTPIDDSEDENNEKVVLTLSASSAYEVSSPSSATVTIADNDEPPPALVADFTASPLLGIIPLVVEFTDTSTGNPVSWNWNFGDGSSSTARHPTHIYLIPGDYTATLTVQNSAGATSNKSVVIRVRLL